MTYLKPTVTGIKRRGYRPFKRTITNVLDEKAMRTLQGAFVREELESMRRRRVTA